MSDSILAIEAKSGRVVWAYQAQSGDAWNAACAFGRRWSCPDPEGPDTDFGGTTALAEVDGRELLFAGHKSGLLHALDPDTGDVFWRFATAREFQTLRGRTTRGGGIEGTAGAMLANGMRFVSSGYGQAQRPGNALIALAPEAPE